MEMVSTGVIKENYVDGWTEYWDDAAKGVVRYNPSTSQFLTFDDARSMAAKAQ